MDHSKEDHSKMGPLKKWIMVKGRTNSKMGSFKDGTLKMEHF